MDNIKILHPKEGVTIAAVKITEKCAKHHIGINKNGTRLYLWDGKGLCTHLPEGPWQIIGLSDQLSEEQWQELIDCELVDNRLGGLEYPNFNIRSKPNLSFDTATEAGLSFLEANGVTDPVLILKRVEPWKRT